MTLVEFARHIGKDLSTVHHAIRAGRLSGFITRVKGGPRSHRGIMEIADVEGAVRAWCKPRDKRRPAWYRRPECYELAEGNKTLHLRRLSGNPALASRWIDEVAYPEDVQRPCRRGDCEPAGTCPWCGASAVAMRISLPAEEAEPAGDATLSCPRCGQQVACRLNAGSSEWRWERPAGASVDALISDPRLLPDAILNHCRPCPFCSCRHHLCFDLKQFSLTFTNPAVPIWEMVESCSLDVVADRPDGVELADLPALVGRSYDRSFQIVDEALLRAREVLDETGEDGCPWKGNRDKPSTLAAIPARSTTKDEWRGRMSGAPMPDLPLLPFRRPDQEEVARLFPGAAVSPDYGRPRPHAGPDGTEGESEITRSRWAIRLALAREARRRRTQDDPGPVPSDQGWAG